MTEKKIKNNMSSSDISSMSSSCLTRGSRNKDIHSTGFPVKRGMTKDLESGRSMVEMLGVLAVVGVLSVGGIAGYTYAMNRYYTNELLAGASERAVLVTAQLALGREPNLNEFAHYQNVGGTFGQAEELEDGSGFIIPVSGVKGAVCENLVKAIDGTDITISQKAEDNTLTDMTAENCDDENPNDLAFIYKTGLGGSGTGSSNKDVGVCANGNPYLSIKEMYGEDPCEIEWGSATCSDDADCVDENEESGCCHPELKICFAKFWDDESETRDCHDLNDNKCVKNSDCASGEFCNLKSFMGPGNSPTVGVCEEIGGSSIKTYIPTGEKFLHSDADLTWWAAENWCTAQGLSLTGTESFTGFMGTARYCSAMNNCFKNDPKFFTDYWGDWFGAWTMDDEDEYEAFRIWGVSDQVFTRAKRSKTFPALCSGLPE